MQLAVVSSQGSVARTRLTVRHASAALPGVAVHVLDVDGTYLPVGDEPVLTPEAAGVPTAELHRRAVVLEPADLVRSLAPALVRTVGRPGEVTVLLAPGVVLLRDPEALVTAAGAGAGGAGSGLVLVSRTGGTLPRDGRHPDVVDVTRSSAYARVVALRDPASELLALWQDATADPAGPGDRWLDVAAATFPHTTVRDPAVLLSAGSLLPGHEVSGDATADAPLLLDGQPVVALDLSGFDPAAPWLLDARGGDPRGRLSDHPALAGVVRRLAEELERDLDGLPRGTRTAGTPPLTTTSLGFPVDATLRALVRAVDAGHADVPDVFDPAASADLLDYLAAPPPAGGPGRYLRAVHAAREDLRATFPQVPGQDEDGFLAWAEAHAVREGYPAVVVQESVRRAREVPRPTGRPAPGVNVVGFLAGELGIGESARLVVGALAAAGVPHRSVPVEQNLASRRRAAAPADAGAGEVFDTTVLCVNADLTPTVSASVPRLVGRSYRIGMWYWEVEDFPAEQHAGFAHVDEVWVATDFVRRAVEPHSPVPVLTMAPPLPQRGEDPTLTRADLGLPDAPLLLFSFDYLSTAERKNPLGLLDAFRRAFTPGEGPVLVLKSINADLRPAEAERVRLAAAAHPDVLLLEGYLDAAERDALVALSDCYVSLHRSEGLGLTMAEAMAWGKPVIATAYSGNLDFMTDENSFLVPWEPVAIPEGAAPYPAGGTWAEPDLDAAAAALRVVVDRPDVAAARGARAARDIATLHSADVAGRRVAARLEEIGDRRRARSRTTVISRLRGTARRTAGRQP